MSFEDSEMNEYSSPRSLDTVATTRSPPRNSVNIKRRLLQFSVCEESFRVIITLGALPHSRVLFTYLDAALATCQTPRLRPPLNLFLVPSARHLPAIWGYRISNRGVWIGGRRWVLPLCIVMAHVWRHCGAHWRSWSALLRLLMLWLRYAIDGSNRRQADIRMSHIRSRGRFSLPLPFRWRISELSSHCGR